MSKFQLDFSARKFTIRTSREENIRKTHLELVLSPQMQKPKIRTMEKLSSEIGVSRPTLSRFFQDPTSVRTSTRARIENALQTVDYVPNFFATKMNRKSSGLIGVIVPHLNDLFFSGLIEAIETSALAADYMVITQNSHNDPALEAQAARNMIAMGADGVIMAPIGDASSIDALSRLKQERPMVFVDSRLQDHFQDVDFIGTDNQQSIGLIVDYLCRSGEPPAFLAMPNLNSNNLEREQAYTSRMHELGHEPMVIPRSTNGETLGFEEYAYRLMDAHFSHGNLVDQTILCANDRLAIGVIRAANRHSLFGTAGKDPSRFRVAGHDDYPLSAFVFPSLTTVTQNTQAIAEAATGQLLRHIRREDRIEDAVTLTFDAELRLRDSA